MSHHSEEFFGSGSGSFWEPGNYRRTTKRIEDSLKLCGDLVALVTERAEIEKSYGKQLKAWSTRWNGLIEKGPEYGTMEAAWKSILVEGDRTADLHFKIKDDLLSKVTSDIKAWQKENLHKSMMQIKEKKEMDEFFKKAQKPWVKYLTKVNKCKSDYHNTCKNEKTAIYQEKNALNDASLSQDQVFKLRDRVKKMGDLVSKSRDLYYSALSDLNSYNARYMEDMKDVFDKCQSMERHRLQCFKDILFQIRTCLNISENSSLSQIYEDFYQTISNCDDSKDLRWWSNTYGANMQMKWPQFEEYAEELRDISGKGKKAIPGITLVTHRSFEDDNAIVTDLGLSESNFAEEKKIYRSKSEPGKSYENKNQFDKKSSEVEDDGEEWDDRVDPLEDDGRPGVLVRAIYDFEATECDELEFKIGELFEKLEDEDEQGWCKGRKDGRVGLYPANYIEVVKLTK